MRSNRTSISWFAVALLTIGMLSLIGAQQPTSPAVATQHPALFLVRDSVMKTGTPPGDTGPWGMGAELIPMFDPVKIHVCNEGACGRSSRGYIDEGLWGRVEQARL